MSNLLILKRIALASQKNAIYTQPPKNKRVRFDGNAEKYRKYLKLNVNEVKKKYEDPIILDVMCGYGVAVRDLVLFHNLEAFGVDKNYHPELRNKFKERFILTPAEDLSCLPDSLFNVVLSSYGITIHAKDEYLALRESMRMLKPGGELRLFPGGNLDNYVTNAEKELGGSFDYKTFEIDLTSGIDGVGMTAHGCVIERNR